LNQTINLRKLPHDIQLLAGIKSGTSTSKINEKGAKPINKRLRVGQKHC
jgi:hypothetical protein